MFDCMVHKSCLTGIDMVAFDVYFVIFHSPYCVYTLDYVNVLCARRSCMGAFMDKSEEWSQCDKCSAPLHTHGIFYHLLSLFLLAFSRVLYRLRDLYCVVVWL